jgi:hypothetical protein
MQPKGRQQAGARMQNMIARGNMEQHESTAQPNNAHVMHCSLYNRWFCGTQLLVHVSIYNQTPGCRDDVEVT